MMEGWGLCDMSVGGCTVGSTCWGLCRLALNHFVSLPILYNDEYRGTVESHQYGILMYGRNARSVVCALATMS